MYPVSDDLQNPDESRPAKRARLDASLSTTEETFIEMNEEDDWDDVYHDGAERITGALDDKAPTAIQSSNQTTQLVEATQQERISAHGLDGVPPEAMSQGDEFIAPEASAQGTDRPSTHMLDETSEAVREDPIQVDQPHGPLGSGEDVETRVREGESSNPACLGEDTDAMEVEDTHIEDALETKDATNREGQAEHRQAGSNGQVVTQTSADAAKGGAVEENGPSLLKVSDDAEFMAAAAAQKGNQGAEWQFDPSDEESSDSDSSDSDDSSDDSDSDSEGGYEMLDPATAARILMSGDGDDDDGERGKGKSGRECQPRTANEKKEEIVPKPDITLTPDMKITLLGSVENAVENLVLIKGATPGEYQVLESGSVLCTESREVVGAVAETFGKVQEPLYSVAFTNAQEIQDYGLAIGAKVFYVDDHSTFVFTQPLRNLKGTDASNIHDEEVGEDEIEFSDDEVEAEYKRQKKLAKKGGRGGLSRSAFNENARNRGTSGRGGSNMHPSASDAPAQAYGGGMSYDDDPHAEGGAEEFYMPLKRPDNLSQLMSGGPSSSGGQRPTFDRGRGRGRGDRGRGRGDRGRGRGRGGYDSQQRAPPGHTGNHQDHSHAHRGSAHSFPDRHNYSANEPKQPHALPPRPTYTQAGATPPTQSTYQQPQPYPFSGNQFPYGNPTNATAYQQPHAHQFNPAVPQQQMNLPQIPTGAYVNPAFYPYQAQQQQQPYATFTEPSAPMQAYGQPPGDGFAPPSQGPDLADIMRQLRNSSGQQ